VDELASTHEAVSAHHGNNYTPLMERYYVGDHEIPQVGGFGDQVIPHPAIT
jgi:hypothetical protein